MIEVKVNKTSYKNIDKITYKNNKIIFIDNKNKKHEIKKQYARVIIHHYI